jgi:NOL1/NOP2/fmu family ribosome biogenesis protein
MNSWSEAHIKHCAERQYRIVADAWDALKEEGLLLYSTCTYNRDENECNVSRIMQNLGAEAVPVMLQDVWNITANEYGYRFFPHKTKGEGFFISLLKKKRCTPVVKRRGKQAVSDSMQHVSASNSIKYVSAWLEGDFTFILNENCIWALPAGLVDDIFYLRQHLHVLQAGVSVGEIKGKEVIPAAAVALSTALRKEAFPFEDVSRDMALHFLHRDMLSLPHAAKGYRIISYQHLPLGFVKYTGSRSNNLYPVAWRIRMDV